MIPNFESGRYGHMAEFQYIRDSIQLSSDLAKKILLLDHRNHFPTNVLTVKRSEPRESDNATCGSTSEPLEALEPVLLLTSVGSITVPDLALLQRYMASGVEGKHREREQFSLIVPSLIILGVPCLCL
ncbi:hypothetical protein AVEN_88884-1 [Araneus ventricosus]|uniref:Uncharacterized protein n=1 Tax=Araneus ventricosus TaxID=182803 RepID=A0A4Y2MFZ0_ARAVE|nr:hypothetical protein AVEN_88884-1 [Araneus ventricosus]